ncbi:MAG TPA: extracellular solute-binding protein [Candidatus Limnocylindrales bacterium]|nr:extracellular solute-binding protein [Candidatus Limnocylindrales bacterium]
MRIKRFLGIGAAAMFVVSACGTAASPAPSSPAATSGSESMAPAQSQAAEARTLTVWLMNGSASDDLVKQLNDEFEAAHPGVTVKYEVQQWNGIVSRLNGALAAPVPPDVVETGNTQTANYAAAGALADLTASRADLGGGSTDDSTSADEAWLGGLNDSSMWDGKLYAVPFYAGNRIVLYNKDQFAAAGLDPASITTKEKLIEAAQKLKTANAGVADYSGLYIPGQNWYALMSFIADHGGQIAKLEGDQWKGTLDSPEAVAGIQDYVDYFKAGSTGPADNDEANPEQAQIMKDGKAGMMIANLWELGYTESLNDAIKGKLGVFKIPSATGKDSAPVFLGGSNLGIAAGSQNQDLALDWVKLLSGEKYQKMMIANGNVPNSKNLAETATSENANLSVAAGAAAAGSFVTPQDPRWASVEAGANPLKDMLTKVLTGQASIEDAAKAANAEIEARMNTPL